MPSASSNQLTATRLRCAGLVLLMAAPVVAAFTLILRFAINIPYIDDYFNFLEFSLKLQQSRTFHQKLYYFITAQYGEYRFVFMHIIATLELAITHRVDMVVLSVAGDLFLLAFLPLLWKIYIPGDMVLERKLLLFCPIVFILFGLNYGESITWPSSTLFYVPGIFFAMLAIHLLVRMPTQRGGRYFAGACLATLFLCWITPSAVALIPIAIFLLISRRAFLLAATWLAVFVCGVSPYLYHYHAYPDPSRASAHASLKLYTLFFVSFVGAGTPTAHGPLLGGLLVLAVVAAAFKMGYLRSNPAALLTVAWVLMSAMLVTYGRAHGGVAFATISRYKSFSDFLFIFCYGFLAYSVRNSRLTPAVKRGLYLGAIFVSITFCVHTDLKAVQPLREQRQNLIYSLVLNATSPAANSPFYFPHDDAHVMFLFEAPEARAVLQECIARKLYVPPAIVSAQTK